MHTVNIAIDSNAYGNIGITQESETQLFTVFGVYLTVVSRLQNDW